MCLKFTADQLALAGISSPLVDYATAQKMVDPTQASINTSAKIDKGESVCVSSFTYWRHQIVRDRMVAAAVSRSNAAVGSGESEVEL